MIDPKVVTELMADFANCVHETLEGRTPKFQAQAWRDRVRLSREFIRGTADSEEIEILTAWTAFTGETVEQFATRMVAEDRQYVKIRLSLDMLYGSAMRQVATATPETLPMVLQNVFQTTGDAMVELSNGDVEVMTTLLAALDDMRSALTEALA